MIELLVVAVFQLALLLWHLRAAASERQRLLNAVIAKDPGEFVALERAAAKPKRKKREEPVRHPHGL